jgi:hypothetical protein
MRQTVKSNGIFDSYNEVVSLGKRSPWSIQGSVRFDADYLHRLAPPLLTMSQEQVETAHTNDEDATRLAIAEAIARRAPAQTHDDDEERQFAMERDTRQKFRRLVDPGIARHTQDIQFEATIKVYEPLS